MPWFDHVANIIFCSKVNLRFEESMAEECIALSRLPHDLFIYLIYTAQYPAKRLL